MRRTPLLCQQHRRRQVGDDDEEDTTPAQGDDAVSTLPGRVGVPGECALPGRVCVGECERHTPGAVCGEGVSPSQPSRAAACAVSRAFVRAAGAGSPCERPWVACAVPCVGGLGH